MVPPQIPDRASFGMPRFGTNQQLDTHKISAVPQTGQCPRLKSKMEPGPGIINFRGMDSKYKFCSYLEVIDKPKRKERNHL